MSGLPHGGLPKDRPVAVVGGAGFIGSNLADDLAGSGYRVRVIDTLERTGVEANLGWLVDRHSAAIDFVRADVRDEGAMRRALADVGAVVHLAAQVAVTTSLDDPATDFAVNAAGTLNVLEAVRATGRRVPVVYASTNKVYGCLDDVALDCDTGRWLPTDPSLRWHGIGESRPLDFRTPYGCSKGVADQYVLDWCASYGLPTAVLRMSCIYGPRQYGTEDQGWVAHFLLSALKGEPITLYGDGLQVRDILHVRDAVRAYRMVLDRIDDVAGRAFNLGGGATNAVSLSMVIDTVAQITGRCPTLDRGPWRTGDQRWFVADTRALEAALGWVPEIGWQEGLVDLSVWLRTLVPAEIISFEDALAARRAIVCG